MYLAPHPMMYTFRSLFVLREYVLMLVAVASPTGVCLLDFFCSGIQLYVLMSPYLCFIFFLYLDLYVPGDDAWIS